MRKLLSALMVALGLSGCSMVTSDQPLFQQADTKDAPVLRPGVWAMPDKAECVFDAKAAAATWPKCANATVVAGDTFIQIASTAVEKQDSGGEGEAAAAPAETGKSEGATKANQTMRFVLAGGQPPVLQLQRPSGETKGPPFVYAGVRVTASDDQKRVTGLKVWLALCSKPEALKGDPNVKPAPPLPGLIMRKGNPTECVATAKDPVRNSVIKSEAWLSGGDPKDMIMQAHWVRDGDS